MAIFLCETAFWINRNFFAIFQTQSVFLQFCFVFLLWHVLKTQHWWIFALLEHGELCSQFKLHLTLLGLIPVLGIFSNPPPQVIPPTLTHTQPFCQNHRQPYTAEYWSVWKWIALMDEERGFSSGMFRSSLTRQLKETSKYLEGPKPRQRDNFGQWDGVV